jgi:hypothetical protein
MIPSVYFLQIFLGNIFVVKNNGENTKIDKDLENRN